MDEHDHIHEGFSQEECIEWAEDRNVDLRQLARASPHSQMTPMLGRATQASSSSKSSRRRSNTAGNDEQHQQQDTPAVTASLVKNLDRNYSPKQEIANLMEANNNQEAHEAPTQPQANNHAKTTDTLGMRHGRRRRDTASSVTKQPKKLKRSNTDPTALLKGRRRPRSLDGRPCSSDGSNNSNNNGQARSINATDGVDFEDLLKEFEKPRLPLHPTRVNMPEKGDRKKAAQRASAPPMLSGTHHAARAVPNPQPQPNSSTINAALTVPRNDVNTNMPNQVHNAHPLTAKESSSVPPVGSNSAARSLPVSVATSIVGQNQTTNSSGSVPPVQQTAGKASAVGNVAAAPSRPVSVATSSAVQNQAANNNSSGTVLRSVEQTVGKTPAARTTAPSASPFIGDDLKLSDDDWDALMTQAGNRRESNAQATTTKKNDSCQSATTTTSIDSYSSKDWKTIQAIDESLARAVGHSSAVTTAVDAKTAANDNKKDDTDEFDDLPMFDFEAIDRQIAERSTAVLPDSSNAPPAPGTPVLNPVSPTFDLQHSFIAFSRYKVVGTEVDNTTYTKTVILQEWRTAMLKEEGRQQAIHHASSLERATLKSEMDVEESSDGRIFLRGEWYHTHVEAGDVVHLCSLSGKFRTDVGALPVVLHTNPPQGSNMDDDLVLIVHPDRLIPPTTISETVTCSRRAVLRMRLGSSGISSKAALIGTMRHELFERCMSNQDFGWPTAKVIATSIVRRNAESLVGCGIKESEARSAVLQVVPQIQRFAAEFTTLVKAKDGRTVGNAQGSRLKGNGLQPDMKFVAHSVQATEESVVCPELGLKGNLDVTVSTTTSALASPGGNQTGLSTTAVPQNALMSIELKTGHNQNPQNAHMAQLALYTMMLRVRRGPNRPNATLSQSSSSRETPGACGTGMLLYLNHEDYRAMHISPAQNEIKSLVGQRNLVASELTKASRPRGVVLAYEEQGDTKAAVKQTEKPSVSLLPAPPADLPEVLSTPHSCLRCYMNRECMTYAAAQLRVSPSTSAQGVDKSHAKLLQHFTGHLSEEHLAYFQEWDRLIDLEADASTSLITTAWLQSSQEQEKASGKCISSLVLDEMETMMANASDSVAANDHRSALIVLNRAPESAITTPLSRLNIERGSHVVVSSDATSLHLSSRRHEPMTQYDDNRPGGQHLRHRMSIARGFLDSIDEKQVTIRVSRDEMGQLSHMNQQYSGLHRSSPGGSSAPPSLRFRVDKDDVSTGTGTLRQNLIKFLTSDVKPPDEQNAADRASKQQNSSSPESSSSSRERLPWLRDAIILLSPPSFDENLRTSMFINSQGSRNSATDSDFKGLAADFSKLNNDQRNAVEKIMCARDYSLVQGLPGTGKTSTIAFVARLLAAHGKRVLITSYTHAAVDNLMMKLIESGLAASNHFAPLIRVGNKSSCHPNVHSILASTVALAREGKEGGDDEFPSPDSLGSVVSSAKIVGVSALTIPRSALLVGQHFDVVIVDEAGQISQPAILGALMAADSFVLVGDHMQLPPLVHSEVAQQGGYNISMLKRLADKHPSSVAQLALQYRMHGAICQLSNDIVYNGKLRCANKDVETRLLSLSGFPSAIRKHASVDAASCWMTKAIDPSQPVVFLDTDRIQRINTPRKPSETNPGTFTSGLERTAGGKNGKGNIVNDTEATLVRQVLHALMECGLEPSNIGVICPFRSQLRLLAQIPSTEELKSKGLEFSTIDRYQGRDKPAIVLSLVRSNQNGKCGRLLEDFRRLNVAVSRAKHKLVIVGSFSTLTKGSDVLRPVLQKIKQRNQIVQLPQNATQSYKQV